MSNKYDKIDLKKFFESFSQEYIQKTNEEILQKQHREFDSFRSHLKDDKCYICGTKLFEFMADRFCLHWFTFPKGIRKKHFEKAFKKEVKFGFFNLDSYFRWLANSEKFIGNINDLKEEISPSSFLETTYKYKNIQWAFSIGNSDLQGHPNSNNGSKPHYHLEMKIDDRVFIKFNDFHFRFTDEDLFNLEMRKQIPDKIVTRNPFDVGMSFLEDETNIDDLNEMMEVTSDYDNATIRYQSVFVADPNNPITGQMLREAMEESRRTKKPIGYILNQKLKNAQKAIIISPGDGVPNMSKRSGKDKNSL